MRIRAKVEFLEGAGAFDLWANLDDVQSRAIDSQSTRIASSSDIRESSMLVDVLSSASKLSFGLRSLGGVTASLESLDIEIIDDGRKSGSSPL